MSVLVDDSAEAVCSAYVHAGGLSGAEGFGDGAQRRRLMHRLAGPAGVVVLDLPKVTDVPTLTAAVPIKADTSSVRV